MVELTKLNGVAFVLNSSLIETIETIPETKVTLTTGKYFLVQEMPQAVVDRVIAYNQKIFKNVIRVTK
ncbi:MAG TPA: endoflagellar protein [Ruminococcaceae bacterium]|nr:endoflagellar protein [Oscillospiraceae bacterium]